MCLSLFQKDVKQVKAPKMLHWINQILRIDTKFNHCFYFYIKIN